MTTAIQPNEIPTLTIQQPLWMRLIPYIGMFLLALLLWLPFGFKTTGLIEEIGLNQLIEQGQQLFFITPSSSLGGVRTRPLQMFAFAAAYALDHDSYLYYNVLMMLFFFGQMVVAYWLVLEFLPGKKALAFVTALLFTIYPADTGLFSLRTIHIHLAILAFLIAVYLFIRFWRLSGRKSWLALFGAIVFLLFSLEQYESPLVTAIATPFILLYFKRINRRFFIGTIAWYAAIAFVFIYAAWITAQSTVQTYSGHLLGKNLLSLESIADMFQALFVGYRRQITGWANAFNQLDFLPLFWPFIVAGLALSFVGIWWLSRKQIAQPNVQTKRWQYIILLLGGVALFAVGMATYLPVPTHRFQFFRIYFLAMLGSALVLTLGLYLISRAISRFNNLLFAVLTMPFIGLSLLYAFEQQQYFVNFSAEQQSILQQIAEQAPQIKPNTSILLIDRTGVLDQPYVFYYGVYLAPMMRYLYEDMTIKSNFCASDNRKTAVGLSCAFTNNILHMTEDIVTGGEVLKNVSSDNLLIFVTKFGGGVHLMTAEEAARKLNITGYDPQARIIGQTLPRRASTMFSCNPAMSCYWVPSNPPSTTFDLPSEGEIGLGWRDTEPDGTGGTFRWSIQPTAVIKVNLSDTTDLAVDFKVLHWVDSSVIDSLKLALNDSDIPLTFESTDDGGRLYHAVIPRNLLTSQIPQMYLVFTVDKLSTVSKDVSLGFALNWLRIRPVSNGQ